MRPIQVGSHGETVRGLLRPGLHSGTVPKAFAKLRRAVRGHNVKRESRFHHAIEHVAEAVHRFGERSFVAYLRNSTRWGGLAVELNEPILAPHRIVWPLRVGGSEIRVAIEEQHGWIIAAIDSAEALGRLSSDQRVAFADALIGFYKRASAHVVREQVAAVFGPQAYSFDAVPEGLAIPLRDGKEHLFRYEDGPDIELGGRVLPACSVVLSDNQLLWSAWVDRWEADAKGECPGEPLIPGWTLLPVE
jgi:hypothetical protein